MLKKLLFIVSVLCSSVSLSTAGPSINQLNSCLALVDFVDIKLNSHTEHYSAADMARVHKGLALYSKFLQEDVITPKLEGMYGGNKTQARLMQKLFDRQRKTFLHHLNERYTEKKLLTDYAASINQCSSNTRLRPDTAKALNTAMNTIIKMAKARGFS